MKEDKQIKCNFVGCETVFIHSVKDQEFYEDNRYVDPKYCKFHREQRKRANEARKVQANSVFKPALDEINRGVDEHLDNHY